MPAPLRGGLQATTLLFFVLYSAASFTADDEKLERFLARLGLVELQIVHVERSLEGATAGPDEQQRLARRLADLYAEQLMNSADDPAAYNDLVQRIEDLLARFPAANTAALQVMLLQADY
ncbi:MAG: hypothetical protein KY475_18500, partial [Planctomycetes bacterium]|nr:hypothetical protein [Planctomycetota bacterium]